MDTGLIEERKHGALRPVRAVTGGGARHSQVVWVSSQQTPKKQLNKDTDMEASRGCWRGWMVRHRKTVKNRMFGSPRSTR